ncbi:PDZ and LIM domain protein Zasp isoform X3 [Ceratitis capitata]|uniref:PDZ and LIM domain protein Zasp isoform X3 n=1 Tax=Ceratitis capitata TaxID=7213 RepID=UPI00032A2918|nr:PDZ and LIM domain protein Zasp isoform X3 [Ceratitis capitata]
MAQPQLLQIKLSRFDAQPWGFRLQGGVDFATPLVVQKVNGGSLAEKAGLIPGDAVLKINDVDVFNLRHKDAQDVVVRSGNNFVLTIQRGGSTWRPHITPTGNVPQPQQNSPYLQTVTKTSLAHKQQESQHIGCGYNNAARPFVNGGDGSVKSIVNKQYNTPVGIYSEESIAETLSAQAEVLAGGVLGVNFKKNEKEYQPDKSEVLKFLREEETGQSSTPEPPAPANFYWTQSHAIGGNTPLSHQHQQQQQPQERQPQEAAKLQRENAALPAKQPQSTKTDPAAAPPPSEAADPRVIIMPVCPALQGPEYKAEMEAAAAALQRDDGPRPLSASGHPACALCGVGIVGVFVRIKDKNLHVECFKCATCGTSLKNQGYYNYNNKLYCDIHAKLAALQSPPAGTDGYVPVPIKPNTKLSATTISSALNAHGFADIPVANGGSVPPTSAPNADANECIDAAKDDITDLPLPPPPSPTLLQQLAIESQFRGSPNDNDISVQRELQHSSTGGSSVSPVAHTTQTESLGDGAVDEKSSGYASTSPIHSRQTSSSSTSTCGFSRDKQAVPLTATIPPPPPPLPISLPAQLNEPSVCQQNENDMNSQNQYGKGGGGNEGNSGAPCAGGVLSPAGGVYSKFLKEYSNKLLTQNKDHNAYTNKLTADISQNKIIDTNYSQIEPSTHTPLIPQSLSARISSPTTGDKTKTISPQPTVVAALSATLANQLNLNSCQQVSNSEVSLNPSAPPALSSSSISTQETTAISETISSKSTSDNRFESEPFVEAVEGIRGTDEGVTSAMSVTNDQPFGEYVTLTGSVIRSVVPPGKGANINYKVNQGYARPFGAASGPPAAAPKSPVAYPPQRPAVNAYATLPRSNIGQQGRRSNTYHNYSNNYSTQFKNPIATNHGHNKYATMPIYNSSHYNNTNYNRGVTDAKTNAQATIIATATATATNAASAVKATDITTTQAPQAPPAAAAAPTSFPPPNTVDDIKSNPDLGGSAGVGGKGAFGATSAPKRGRGIFNKAVAPGVRVPLCSSCNIQIRGPFITALGRIWCPEHFICVNANCRRPLQDIGFVEEKGDLYCEYCFEKYLAPSCSKCGGKIKGDCLNAIGKQFHPECFTCGHCGKLFGNTPFFLEDGNAYCEADWNELFTTKCFACGFPVEAGDRWVEALNHNYHSQCFNCTYCKQNLEGQSFYNKGGRPFCKNHAR